MLQDYEQVRALMQTHCEAGHFESATRAGDEALASAEVSADVSTSYGPYWELRDLLRRIHRKGLENPAQWAVRVKIDYRDLEALRDTEALEGEMLVIFTDAMRDRADLAAQEGEFRLRADICARTASELERLLGTTSEGALRLHIEAAHAYVQCAAASESEHVAREGLVRFGQLFPPTHYAFDSKLAELAAPLCKVLGQAPSSLAKPSLEDLQELADGPPELVGRALRFAIRMTADSPSGVLARDVWAVIEPCLEEALEDLEEHASNEALYGFSERELRALAAKLSGQ